MYQVKHRQWQKYDELEDQRDKELKLCFSENTTSGKHPSHIKIFDGENHSESSTSKISFEAHARKSNGIGADFQASYIKYLEIDECCSNMKSQQKKQTSALDYNHSMVPTCISKCKNNLESSGVLSSNGKHVDMECTNKHSDALAVETEQSQHRIEIFFDNNEFDPNRFSSEQNTLMQLAGIVQFEPSTRRSSIHMDDEEDDILFGEVIEMLSKTHEKT